MRNTENDRISLPAEDGALLAECDMETFRSGGPGGQHQNKVETGVRLRHRSTGLVVSCRETRSQAQNRQLCVLRLRELVARLNHRVKPRIETRIPRKAHAVRLEAKKRRGEKKRGRGKVKSEE